MPKLNKDSRNIFLEFSFTQKERDNVLKYCFLSEEIKKRFRKIAKVGSVITLVFYKTEAEEMLESLSQVVFRVFDDKNLKEQFNDLHARFELMYNEVFH